MLTGKRSMQSSFCKIETLQEHFWQLSQHVAANKDFFVTPNKWDPKPSTSEVQQNMYFRCAEKHFWIPQSYLADPAFPIFCSPYLRLWHMEFSKSYQLNFPEVFLTVLNYYSPAPSDSFTQGTKQAEKKKKRAELKLQCGEKNRDYLGGSCGTVCGVRASH